MQLQCGFVMICRLVASLSEVSRLSFSFFSFCRLQGKRIKSWRWINRKNMARSTRFVSCATTFPETWVTEIWRNLPFCLASSMVSVDDRYSHNLFHLVLQGYISLWGSSRCTNEIAFSYSKTLLQRYHPEVLEGHSFGVHLGCGSHAVEFFSRVT